MRIPLGRGLRRAGGGRETARGHRRRPGRGRRQSGTPPEGHPLPARRSAPRGRPPPGRAARRRPRPRHFGEADIDLLQMVADRLPRRRRPACRRPSGGRPSCSSAACSRPPPAGARPRGGDPLHRRRRGRRRRRLVRHVHAAVRVGLHDRRGRGGPRPAGRGGDGPAAQRRPGLRGLATGATPPPSSTGSTACCASSSRARWRPPSWPCWSRRSSASTSRWPVTRRPSWPPGRARRPTSTFRWIRPSALHPR